MKQIIYKAALLLGILICLFGIPLCVRAETDEPDAATLSETGPEDPASGVISEAVPEQENTIALPDSTDLAEAILINSLTAEQQLFQGLRRAASHREASLPVSI